MIEADDVEASARDLGGAVSAGRPRDRIEGSQHGAIDADGDGVVETIGDGREPGGGAAGAGRPRETGGGGEDRAVFAEGDELAALADAPECGRGRGGGSGGGCDEGPGGLGGERR